MSVYLDEAITVGETPMYSVHCKTCSEKTTAESYASANDVFMKHAECRHMVELVNSEHMDN